MIANSGRPSRRRQSGFTLIELLVVIIILGILAAVVVFAVRGADDKGHDAAVAVDERTIRTAMETYCAKNGTYPMPDGTEGRKTAEEVLVTEKYLSGPSDYHDIATGGGPLGNCSGQTYDLTVTTPPDPTSTTNPPDAPPVCGDLEGWCRRRPTERLFGRPWCSCATAKYWLPVGRAYSSSTPKQARMAPGRRYWHTPSAPAASTVWPRARPWS